MIKPADTPAFDEAARLYVQNLPVVQEMERAFEQAVDKFLHSVRRTIDGISAPLRLSEERTPKYLSWYLTNKKEDESLVVPYVWFEYRRPDIVIPGELRITVDIEKEGKSRRPRIEKALRRVELPPYCQPTKVPDCGRSTSADSEGYRTVQGALRPQGQRLKFKRST